jgi:hypothetical protein
MRWLIGAAVVAFFILIAFFFETFIYILAWTITTFVILFACISLYFFIRLRQIELKSRLYEARGKKYLSFQDGFGMMHLLNLKTDIIENVSAYPGSHHNGVWRDPAAAAAAAWYALVSKKSESPVALLPEQRQQQAAQLDLLTIFTQPTQSYAVIAGQQVGKTYQMQQIAAYWRRQGIKTIVIGPKRDVGEWPDCEFFGGNYNFVNVQRGLRIVEQLAKDRHKDDKPHKQHLPQPVFIDDWTSIREKIRSEAEAFIIDATVLYASVNIILYFIIHIDTANAWGVGRIGAALKDNFIKLVIEPGYNDQGLIDRKCNRGYLIRPGETKKDRQAIKLFNSIIIPDAIETSKDS